MADSTRRMNKMSRPKNKHAAAVQITAEQLLLEANERQLEVVAPTPRQTISDPEELAEYQMTKRKSFEDALRKNKMLVGNWVKYAAWEESQEQMERARSVYERALGVDHRNIVLWQKYAEFEMRHRQINHARNIWDKAIAILPRVPQFWLKYSYMEEMMGNVAGARQIFERWMEWRPDESAWLQYIAMEMRYGEVENARNIYERLVQVHYEVKNWIRFAKFELRQGQLARARAVYERAVEFFGTDHMDEALFVQFAKFEEAQKEYDRARVIYKYALDNIPKQHAKELFAAYTQFEKKFGDRAGVESVILNKRRFQYEEEVKTNPYNYDAWFDYVRLSEEQQEADKTRELYERAISHVPPAAEKRLWRRYIYLWINYALFEELETKDFQRTRDVYNACLRLIPHKQFTFAKVWLLFAQFEIRQKNLTAARSILGTALGKCPKEKLFKGYIELELQLREFDRCRTLYEKFLEFNPANGRTWIKFAELETVLGDIPRARAIYNLAIEQPLLDMPELLWKAYIDFETELGEFEYARDLYAKLLDKTSHVKVWISYAKFEASLDSEDAVSMARKVYSQADAEVKKSEDKAERLLLLEAWLAFEMERGDEEHQKKVRTLMPRKVKKRRELFAADGTSEGFEEYYDYIYPDEQSHAPNLKLLEMARMWKMQKESGASANPLALIKGAEGGDADEQQQEQDRDEDGDEAGAAAAAGQDEGEGEGEGEERAGDE
eukprot:m.166966 g.166966  ORF g.166966 m.166966 type:complete len:725 (+) comp17185_c0_seq1:107-2281(+)